MRALTVVGVLALLAGLAATRPAPALAVSGGAAADDAASAFVAHLEIRRTASTAWTCSGSLVAPQLVLTAAHCLYSRRPGDWTVTFAAGPASSVTRGVLAVAAYSPSSGAGPVTSVDDLALVQLDRPVTDRAPVTLDRAGALDRLAGAHGPVVEIGYGSASPTTTAAPRRAAQTVVATIATLPAVGLQSVVPLVETGPAASGTLPGGSCQPGDSGGPVVGVDSVDGAAPVLLAVTSRGSADTGRCWSTRIDAASPYRAWLGDAISRFGG